MEEAKTWWALASQLGVGATFVLGICTVFVWRALRDEQTYSRKRDIDTLETLNKITNLLDKEQTSNVAIIDTVKAAEGRIIEHIKGMKS